MSTLTVLSTPPPKKKKKKTQKLTVALLSSLCNGLTNDPYLPYSLSHPPLYLCSHPNWNHAIFFHVVNGKVVEEMIYHHNLFFLFLFSSFRSLSTSLIPCKLLRVIYFDFLLADDKVFQREIAKIDINGGETEELHNE